MQSAGRARSLLRQGPHPLGALGQGQTRMSHEPWRCGRRGVTSRWTRLLFLPSPPFPTLTRLSLGPGPAACRVQQPPEPPEPQACGDTARPEEDEGPAGAELRAESGRKGRGSPSAGECPPSGTVPGGTAGPLWRLEDSEGEAGRDRDRCPMAVEVTAETPPSASSDPWVAARGFRLWKRKRASKPALGWGPDGPSLPRALAHAAPSARSARPLPRGLPFTAQPERWPAFQPPEPPCTLLHAGPASLPAWALRRVGWVQGPPWLPLDLSGRRPGAGLSPAPPRRRPPSLDSPLAFQQTPSPGRLGAGQGCGEPGALPRPSALPLGRGRGDSTHQRVRASAACRRRSVEPPSGPRWRGGVQAGAGASRASRLWALIGVPEREVCPHARRGCSGMGTLCLQPPVPEGRSLRPDYR